MSGSGEESWPKEYTRSLRWPFGEHRKSAGVVGELLGDLMHRGFDFTEPRLYVWMAANRCTPAVKKYAGDRPRSSVHRLHVLQQRRMTLANTDVIESAWLSSKGFAVM